MAGRRGALFFHARWGAVVLGLALLWGCGAPPSVPCQRVRGQVQQAGKPLAEALVVFHSVETPSIPFPKPHAHTDEQGRFELTTFHTGDGAPAGSYGITVELRAPRQVGEEIVRDGPNVLPARYLRPDTSGLTAQVTEGENELAPIVIEAR